ncbi:hypothetical protein P5V15_010075 [Pogonomyrmex californicus]
MSGQQEAANPAKLENIRKIFENSVQNVEQNLLLSTMYPLNTSHTKKLHVGLQLSKEKIFEPVVKLSGNSAEGISFDPDTWQQFQDSIRYMSAYFNGSSKSKVNPITFANIFINFTSAYGAKAVLVTYKENENFPKESSTGNTQADSKTEEQPPSKKRKTYSVAVVMQQATFQGMANIVKCVDAHINQLASIVDTVNECARYLIKEIELCLLNNYIDADIVKLTVRGNQKDIELAVRTQINNLPFLDTYFDIVFLELITLKFKEITTIILLNREL